MASDTPLEAEQHDGDTVAKKSDSRKRAPANPDQDSEALSPERAEPAGLAPAPAGNRVASREDQYIIAAKPMGSLGLAGMGASPRALEDVLAALDGVELLKTHRYPGLRRFSDPTAPPDVHVVRMSPSRAETLRGELGNSIYFEPDRPFRHGPIGAIDPSDPTPGLGIAATTASAFRVGFVVLGRDGAGVEGTQVKIFGNQGEYAGTTDANGRVTISLVGEVANTIKGLVATPRDDYWMTFFSSPRLDTTQDNLISLLPLEQEFAGFPATELSGWALSAMGLDQLPTTLRGQGVKVAIVDTGIAADTHPDLQGQVEGGVSIVDQDATAWNQDMFGHGTHVAGIIAGLPNGRGIRGVAPGVKLRAYKIFPGGGPNELVAALDECIKDQVDIVNLSLGQADTSELVEGRIRDAKANGIACFVAAGNSWGKVEYPGRSPEVMTVAALGRQGTFPSGSWHSTVPLNESGIGFSPEGFFSANFTCWGPEIGICAPGVAIVSCFPPDGYAAWDGTSMATPYVAGLAALVLAHHPDFQGPYSARNSQRVEHLFEIMRRGARPVILGASPNVTYRVGAGLASSASLGLSLPAAGAPAQGVQPTSGAMTQAQLEELLRALITAALASTGGAAARG